MLKRNLKALKNRAGLRLRPVRNYRIAVFVVLAVFSMFLPYVQTNAAVEGDGRFIYGDGTSVTPNMRAYQGNTRVLAAEAALPTAGATVKATIIEATSVRDEMIAGVLNSGNLLTVYRWNGTAWSSQWTVTLPSTHTPSFDIAYEAVSGKAMVVYSANVATTNEMAYRTSTGGTWTAATAINPARTTGIIHAIVATARPGTNEIAIAYGDENLDLSANYWSGSAWLGEPAAVLETSLARIDTLDTKIQSAVFDVEFEQQGGEALIVWAKDGENGVRSVSRTVGSSAQWILGFNHPMVGTPKVRSISLAADPGSDYIAIATEGDVTIGGVVSWRVIMGVWNGSGWIFSGTASSMDKSTYGQNRIDVTWIESNGQVRAVMAYDGSVSDYGYRSYNKNTGVFGATISMNSDSTSFSQLRLVTNPFNRSEMLFIGLGTDNKLQGDKLHYDDSNFLWVNISATEATVETAITSQTTMTGWATGFAYDLFVPAALLPAPGTPDATLFFDPLSAANPTYRNLTLATNAWSAAGQLPTGVARSEFMDVKASPVRNEKIAAFVDTAGQMEVFRWAGTYWRKEWAATVGVSKTPRVSIAYEQISGKAIVMYSGNSTSSDELRSRTWNGSSWSTESMFNTLRTNGIISYIVTKSRPGTNEIAVAWGDNNMDMSANYWTGSAWAGEPASTLEGNLGALSASPTEIETPIMDLAFESTSGNLLIAWGHNNYTTTDPLINNTLRRVTRAAGPSGAWGSVVQSVFNYEVRAIQLASDPTSNYISMVFHSTGRADGTTTTDTVRFGYWNGTSWGSLGAVLISSDLVAGELDVSTVWLTGGGTTIALFVFDRANATTDGIHYTWYNRTANTWSYDTAGGTYRNSTAPLATFGKRQMKLVKDPADASKATIILVDDNNDLFVKRLSFDGTNVAFTSVEEGGVAMAADITSSTALGWKSDFVYQNNTPVPSILAVDIVNASGVPVSAPTVTMTSLMAGNTCQTATGTFGSSGQRIRLQNTTATPGWTVSLAPTAGSTSNWSSGTASYDFNDASGTPAGCGDGADADAIAGRLTVNPSVGTLTGLSSCSLTGVTKGTSNAFTEGTVNSITLMTGASNAVTNCYWDLVGVSLSQSVPISQVPGRYTMDMTLTTVAN